MFTFLPGIRRFPHIAYPHTHDMDYLFDNINNWMSLRPYEKIHFTPCRRIGKSTEFIMANYHQTLTDFANELPSPIIISNHIPSSSVPLYRFQFSKTGQFQILNMKKD